MLSPVRLSRAPGRRHGANWGFGARCFVHDFEAVIAHLRLPISHRRSIPTIDTLVGFRARLDLLWRGSTMQGYES